MCRTKPTAMKYYAERKVCENKQEFILSIDNHIKKKKQILDKLQYNFSDECTIFIETIEECLENTQNGCLMMPYFIKQSQSVNLLIYLPLFM